MSERQIEMFWRCSSCKHRNLGRHQTCQSCGNPKDGSEQYEMPENPAAAVTVTDEALLRMATAGPNWRCAYCGSDQRAYDGKCKRCGASLPADSGTPPARSKKSRKGRWGCLALVGAAVMFCICIPAPQRSELEAAKASSSQEKQEPQAVSMRVEAVSWEHTVSVERYQVLSQEGFAEKRPAGAFDVRSMGKRHHHNEKVLNGYETVYFTEKKRDGYDTEKYTARESCGQDCTTTPRQCSENCTSNKNGFATCKTVCSGGDKRCTTRYCSVTKTRQVPRFVEVKRSRQEPRYRQEPRTAEWYAWKAWDWKLNRRVKAAGTATAGLRWPADAEVGLGKGVGKGEKERKSKQASYSVSFVDDHGQTLIYEPQNESDFLRFPLGTLHTFRLEQGKPMVSPPGSEPPPAR